MAKGRQPGVQNYKNHLLIPIIEKQLPTVAKGWSVVAGLYKEASGENILRDRTALHAHWFNRLCNGNKKPTGRKGEDRDCIHRCIQIERAIMEQTHSGLVGKESGDEGGEEAEEDGEDGDICKEENVKDAENEEFGDTNDVDDNAQDEEVSNLVSTRDSSSIAVLRNINTDTVNVSKTSRKPTPTAGIFVGGATKKTNEKTKNSSNKNLPRASITKSVQQLCASLENDRTSGVGNDMMMQVMNQTLQFYQSQQQSMQLQQINAQVNARIDKIVDIFNKFMKKSRKLDKRPRR